MRSAMAKILCLVAAFSLLEGQTLVYQTYAWATMLQDRIPQRGLTEAIDSTFSGAEPCQHCQQITKQQSKKKREQAPTLELSPTAKAITSKWLLIHIIPPVATRTEFSAIHIALKPQYHPNLPTPPPDYPLSDIIAS